MENTTPVALLDREEVAMAIQRLNLKKASGYDGLPAELFKAGGDELVSACTTFSATYIYIWHEHPESGKA